MISETEYLGKVVLVTGASSGIGATIAINFSKLGASLALTGRNLENLQKTQQQCLNKNTVQHLLIKADLSEEEDVKTIIHKTIQHFGKLDILINNAGIAEPDSVQSTTLDQFDRIFKTNIKVVLQLTQLAVPFLKLTKGNIINVSSICSLIGCPNVLTYGMSKKAMDQFTQSVALDLAQYQVRVNSVNPGIIVTDIFRKSGMSETETQEYFEKAKKLYPIGRVGQPKDVADAVIFLASEKASFITGILLPIDGGIHITTLK